MTEELKVGDKVIWTYFGDEPKEAKIVAKKEDSPYQWELEFTTGQKVAAYDKEVKKITTLE